MAIASRSVDLPLPFSPMRNVTALERSRASMALMEGIENGNASRSGTVSQQISAEIRPPVGSATPPVNSTQLRSEEHTSELQSLMRISYAVFCLKKKKTQ